MTTMLCVGWYLPNFMPPFQICFHTHVQIPFTTVYTYGQHCMVLNITEVCSRPYQDECIHKRKKTVSLYPSYLILRLSARLFVLLGLIGGVMSHLDFQYISIVAWSYICVYRPVFPVWRCKTLKSAW